jgi:hypothetical protein
MCTKEFQFPYSGFVPGAEGVLGTGGSGSDALRVFKIKTTAHIEEKNPRGFVLLTRRSNFPGLWLKPKGPTEVFRLILSRSKVMTSFLLTFARELSTTKDQF